MECIKFDKETRKWFREHPEKQATLCRCEKCGLYYKPSLGHKCRGMMMDYQEAIEALRLEGGIEITGNPRRVAEFFDAIDVAISAMQELQAIHNNGISLERLKDIDFRKQVVEHINYMDYMDIKDELEKYKQIGTLEEVREVVEKHNECKNCVYKIHSERISKLNNCNDCGLLNTCVKRPEYGDYCRINCYDWSEKE